MALLSIRRLGFIIRIAGESRYPHQSMVIQILLKQNTDNERFVLNSTRTKSFHACKGRHSHGFPPTHCNSFRRLCDERPSSAITTVHELVQQPSVFYNRILSLRGWIKSIRIQKKFTFIDLIDGLSPHRLQVVAETINIPHGLSYHSAIFVMGALAKSNHKGQDVELHATKVDLVNATSLELKQTSNGNQENINSLGKTEFRPGNKLQNEKENDDKTEVSKMNGQTEDSRYAYAVEYPFAPRICYPEDFCRSYPQFRSKLPDFGCMLRVRSTASFAVHEFFRKR